MIAFQYPGRENRISEAPCRTLDHLAESAFSAIQNYLDRPYCLLGFSMGGFVALEVARIIRARGGQEAALFVVCCCPSPETKRDENGLLELTDEALILELHRRGGVPDEALKTPDVLQLALPAIRADLQAIAHYKPAVDERLSSPFLIIGGLDDQYALESDLRGWRRYCTEEFVLHVVPGDHFLIANSPENVGALVMKYMDRYLTLNIG